MTLFSRRSNFTSTFGPISLALLLCLFQAANAAPDNKQLTLYNWSDYMPKEILQAFYKETGYQVREIYYETDELKDALLFQTRGEGLDLIIGSGISFISLTQAELLSPINTANSPNLKHLDPHWQNLFPKIKQHAVPYLWGTLGIVYRKDLIKQQPNSWMQLFNPESALKGRIMMINDGADTFGAALKALGHTLNSTNPNHIDAAYELLTKQKNSIHSYSYINTEENSELLSGDIWMAMAYNGDALQLQEYNPDIAYVVPKEGSNLWVDFIAVTKKSRNKKAAQAFINFINRPVNAALIANELTCGSPNRAAKKFLPAKHLNNPLIYPEDSVIQQSEVNKTLPIKAVRLRNNYFGRLVD